MKTALGIALMTCTALRAGAAQQTEANVVVEIPFRAEKAHANSFLDVNG